MLSLPDEIVNEILKPVLEVSDEVFSDTGPSSFNFRSEISTSAFLLVCKQWLRVATPLLFEVVILRSPGQARALARVLKANNQFGHFIRRLRVEGGYGMAMQTIIWTAPKITDLYLTLSVRSGDNVQALCKALPSLNPHRLIIHEFLDLANPLYNSKTKLLMEALEKCLNTKWTNLTTCQIPYNRPGSGSFPIGRAQDLAEMLEHSPRLETIVVARLTQSFAYPEILESFARIPHLQRVVVLATYTEAERQGLIESLPEMPVIAKLIQFLEPIPEPIERDGDAALMARSYSRLASVPDQVQDDIWSRILWFVVDENVLESLVMEGPTMKQLRDILEGQSRYLLISKRVHRVALPLLYRTLVISSPKQLKALWVQLSTNPSRASHISHLYFASYVSGLSRSNDDKDDMNNRSNAARRSEVEQTMIDEILPMLSHLRYFGITNPDLLLPTPLLHWSAFETLCRTAGRTLLKLRGFKIIEREDHQYLSAISHLMALRSLEWHSRMKFNLYLELSPNCLPLLEELILTECDATMIEALALLELPSLKTIMLLDALHPSIPMSSVLPIFDANGPKLRRIELRCNRAVLPHLFDCCSRLVELVLETSYHIGISAPQILDHIPTSGTNTLEKIIIRKRPSDWMGDWETLAATGQESRRITRQWAPFFNHLDLSSLPAMREIQFTWNIWPLNQHMRRARGSNGHRN